MVVISNWRKNIEENFPELQMRLLDKSHEFIMNLTVEECLQKFDIGHDEHGDDVESINAELAFKEEMIDALNYSALL